MKLMDKYETKSIQRTIKLTPWEFEYIEKFGNKRFNTNLSMAIRFFAREEENKRKHVEQLREEAKGWQEACKKYYRRLQRLREMVQESQRAVVIFDDDEF